MLNGKNRQEDQIDNERFAGGIVAAAVDRLRNGYPHDEADGVKGCDAECRVGRYSVKKRDDFQNGICRRLLIDGLNLAHNQLRHYLGLGRMPKKRAQGLVARLNSH